jgi:hypothetical protein
MVSLSSKGVSRSRLSHRICCMLCSYFCVVGFASTTTYALVLFRQMNMSSSKTAATEAIGMIREEFFKKYDAFAELGVERLRDDTTVPVGILTREFL